MNLGQTLLMFNQLDFNIEAKLPNPCQKAGREGSVFVMMILALRLDWSASGAGQRNPSFSWLGFPFLCRIFSFPARSLARSSRRSPTSKRKGKMRVGTNLSFGIAMDGGGVMFTREELLMESLIHRFRKIVSDNADIESSKMLRDFVG